MSMIQLLLLLCISLLIMIATILWDNPETPLKELVKLVAMLFPLGFVVILGIHSLHKKKGPAAGHETVNRCVGIIMLIVVLYIVIHNVIRAFE